MKKLDDLSKDVSQINEKLIGNLKLVEPESAESKILNHCLLTGMTLIVSAKETKQMLELIAITPKVKLSVLELNNLLILDIVERIFNGWEHKHFFETNFQG